MSKAVPAVGVASDSGTTGSCIIYGTDSRPGFEGNPFGMAFLLGEAWGGTPACDGISFCMTALFNCRSVVMEYTEKDTPLIFWEYGLVIDAAGAGEFRGGYSPVGAVEAYGPAFVTPLLDGARFLVEGAYGGGAGCTSYGMLVERDARGGYHSWNGVVPVSRCTNLYGIFDEHGRPDPVSGEFGKGTRFQTAKLPAMPLEPGQIYRQQVASPAGYGDPLAREVDAVRSDVFNELVSPGQVGKIYGVVFEAGTLEVNKAATEDRRRELREARPDGARTPVAFFAEWPVTEEEFETLSKSPVVGSQMGRDGGRGGLQ